MSRLSQTLNWGKFAPLRLRARTLAEGVYAGSHRSPRRGSGIEFGGHRQYVPGDDLRFVDRHALMRHGELLIREFETETDRDLWLIVDASASMSFASDRAPGPKYGYAALLAAALAYVALRSGDRVGLDFVAGRDARPQPPSGGRDTFERVVAALEGVTPAEDVSSDLPRVVQAIAQAERKARRGAVHVVFSDLVDLPAGSLESLAALASRGRSLCVVQVLDPAERDFPFQGAVRLKALEASKTIETDADQARRGYLEALARAQREAEQTLVERGGRLVVTASADPAEEVVRQILAAVSGGGR